MDLRLEGYEQLEEDIKRSKGHRGSIVGSVAFARLALISGPPFLSQLYCSDISQPTPREILIAERKTWRRVRLREGTSFGREVKSELQEAV